MHPPTLPGAEPGSSYKGLATQAPMMQQRKLKLKAKLETSLLYYSFKHLIPGGFNLGFTGSTCTALP